MDEVEKFFLPISKSLAWALRVSGMGGYTSKCEKMSKSLHPNGEAITTRNLGPMCWIKY